MVASRKTKYAKSRRKGWKKVNIDEVEQYLDDVRLKERIGVPLDQPAFTIEKEGSKVEDKVIEKKQSKKRSKLKTTKDLVKTVAAYRTLAPSSKVPPITFGKSQKQVKQKGKQKRKPEESEKLPKTVGKSIKRKRVETQPYDIWSGSEELRPRKKKPENPSLLPAVELPHPGTSVNPSIADHQDLLRIAHEVELKKLKQEQHYKRVITKYKNGKTPQQLEREWVAEMSGGLNLEGNEEEEGGEEHEEMKEGEADADNGGFGPIKKVIRAEDRKPKAKRRRELLAKLKQQAIKKEKERKQRESKIFQLKRIKKEISELEAKSKERQELKKKKLIQKLYQPHQLGPHKFEEPDIALNLSEEITPRLRAVKAEGDPFEERLKSLQKRNVIEPRKLIMKSFKRKLKYTEKKGYNERHNKLD